MGNKKIKWKNKDYWDALKEAFAMEPNEVNGQWTARTQYYWWILLRKAKSLFKIECPDNWDKDYMLDCLLIRGKFCVTDTGVGIVPLDCNPYGVNLFNRHTKINVANPVLKTFRRTIGEDCELVYLNDDRIFANIVPYLNIYSEQLAQCDAAIDVNLMNSKTCMVFGANSKAEAETLKMMYEDMSQGKPAVFVRQSDLSGAETQVFMNKVKENYIAGDIHIEKRRIMEEFLTEFGVNNANTDKRERLNADEVNSNNEELLVNTNYWVENLQECCDKVNKMFPELKVPLSITMPFRGSRSNIRPESEDRDVQVSGQPGAVSDSARE